jgi:hypothetical protein
MMHPKPMDKMNNDSTKPSIFVLSIIKVYITLIRIIKAKKKGVALNLLL